MILRLLGLELKLRQYKLGKAFCDAVVAEAGIEGLNQVWRAPEALPTSPSSSSRSAGCAGSGPCRPPRPLRPEPTSTGAVTNLPSAGESAMRWAIERCNAGQRAGYKHVFGLIDSNNLRNKDIERKPKTHREGFDKTDGSQRQHPEGHQHHQTSHASQRKTATASQRTSSATPAAATPRRSARA